MAAKKTIAKAVCDKCGHVAEQWYLKSKHGYNEGDCGGIFGKQDVAREVLTGEFTYDRSYGNSVQLCHVKTGRRVNIYTVDLLKVLIGRGLGTLTLTESKRGSRPCWKAEEVGK